MELIYLMMALLLSSFADAKSFSSASSSLNNNNNNNNNMNKMDDPNLKLVIETYLEDTKEAQLYRKEINRQLDLITHLVSAMRHDSPRDKQVLASMIERLRSTYDELDNLMEIFVPDDLDQAEIIKSLAQLRPNDSQAASSDESSDETTLRTVRKRFAWPKRNMYASARYNKIPVIRTGK